LSEVRAFVSEKIAVFNSKAKPLPKFLAKENVRIAQFAVLKILAYQFFRSLAPIFWIERRKTGFARGVTVHSETARKALNRRDVRNENIGAVLRVLKSLLRDVKSLTRRCLDIAPTQRRQFLFVVRRCHQAKPNEPR